MAGTGQTINDRLNAVRYALVGQGLARTVCKATTEEVLGPKKKHLDYLLVCTQEPNVSVPQLANLLIERTQHLSWTVVFKGLISIHHLMAFGNERFTQYLATSNHSFSLPDFMDRSTPQGYTMSTFVRRYSKYINDKCISYRNLAIDICKLGTGNDNPLRTMNMEKLSKTLPIVHEQYDSLLEFEAEAKDLNNGIIMAAFRLLYKDLVRLYIAYQEAIINLLERYFKLSRKKTREAFGLYKQYLSRMDKVASFFKVADSVGLDKSEMPDLTKSPASILTLLEQHLAQLEAKKKGVSGASPAPVSPQHKDAIDDATDKVEQMKVDDSKESLADDGTSIERIAACSSNMSISSDTHPEDPRSSDKTATQATHPSDKSPTSSKHSSPGPQPRPPKPARPSPVTASSHKSNPSPSSTVTKPTSKVSPSIAPTTTQPQSSGGPPMGSTPPDRPAKPPSRPPPPGPSTTPSNSTPVKKAPPVHPPAPTPKAPTPTPQAPATAPPHPPPPSHMPNHSVSASTPAQDSTTTTNSTSESHPSKATQEIASPAVEEPYIQQVEDSLPEQNQERVDEVEDHQDEPARNEVRAGELRAPNAQNNDRPDSGVGSPTTSEGETHLGPTCSSVANQIDHQLEEDHLQNHEQLPNYNSVNHQMNGHISEDYVEHDEVFQAPAQEPVSNEARIHIPGGVPAPPPLDENGHEVEVNNVNNNSNANEAHNGE